MSNLFSDCILIKRIGQKIETKATVARNNRAAVTDRITSSIVTVGSSSVVK